MSYEEAALEKTTGHNANACLRYGQAICRLIRITRPIAVLAAFLSLSGLLGVAAPTLAQAQTASGLPVDANGWTVFTPSADTHIIYVSSSTGNDSTGLIGDINHPYKTLDKGTLLLRQGYPDWMLLKQGDAWVGGIWLYTSGRSAAEPMVIGSYDPTHPGVVNPVATAARPLINVPSAVQAPGIYSPGAPAGNFLAVVGVEFYAYDRDPSNANFNASTVDSSMSGVVALAQFSWMLIEDCKISFFGGGNLEINPTSSTGPNSTFVLRRSVVANSYGISTGSHYIAQGVHIVDTENVTLEENVLDNNGWNATVPSANDPQARGFNHNVYLQGRYPDARTVPANTGRLTVGTIRGNIFSNDSSGSQFRSGGTVDGNLFFSNPYPHNIGAPTTDTNYVTNNVYLEGIETSAANSWGPGTMGSTYEGDNYNIGQILFTSNIVAHSQSPTPSTGSGTFVWDTGFAGDVTITSNFVCGWGANPIEGAGTNPVSGNHTKVADCNAGGWDVNSVSLGQPSGLIDGTRTIETYDSSVLGGPGTMAHFLSQTKKQQKSNWNRALTANGVNGYIRAGFGITSGSVTPPTATPTGTPTDTTPPTAPAGLAAQAASSTQVNLSWIASTDNVGVTGYNVFRNGTKVGTTASTSYQDNSDAAGTTYTYIVSAYDAASNTSAQSSSVSVTTPATPTVTPPPSVAIDSPTNGATPNGSVNIAVSANSAIGIASITITADSNPLASCKNVTSCSATWQKKKLSNGTHTVSGIAVDKNGIPAKASVTVTILR